MRRSLLFLCLAAWVLACTPSDPGPRVEKYVESREVMGTWATITVIAGDHRQAVRAMERGFAFLDSVNAWMSIYQSESEIARINREAYRRPVPVSETTFAVLQRALEFSALTAGAFDITVGPLSACWKGAAAEGRVPEPDELEAARRIVGSDKIVLDPETRTVRFLAGGMRIDLGGIAKGFAVDGAAAAVREAGVSDGIVEVGGDLRCFGRIPAAQIGRRPTLPVRTPRDREGIRHSEKTPYRDLRPWPLGVQNPFDERLLGKIAVPEGAVATSGHYRRYITIGNRRFSHILDPRTGWPVETPASVTTIAVDALTADALATAITVLGTSTGLALAESLPGVEALVVTGAPEAPELRTTSGFPKLAPLAGSR
jgi:thiamine biosynthesis lipoprotein